MAHENKNDPASNSPGEESTPSISLKAGKGILSGTEMAEASPMERILEKARMALLDLGRKNRLIHLREKTRTALHIEDEIPAEVFSILVDQEVSMRFLPAAPKKAAKDAPIESTETGVELEDDQPSQDAPHSLTDSTSQSEDAGTDADSEVIPPADPPAIQISEIDTEPDTQSELLEEEKPAERHIDRYLQTGLNQKKLNDKLLLLFRETQNALEEQGTHLLFIALGFLEWSEESKPGTEMISPLVLIPVELERKNILSPFRLRFNGDDIQTNLCLEKKLSEEYGLDFPEESKIESREDFEQYIGSIEKQIEGRDDWKVTSRVALGLFTFTKFLMYRDLNPRAWRPVSRLIENPLLNSLLTDKAWNSDQLNQETREMSRLQSSFEEADKELGKGYLILDADQSQRAAVQAANLGVNLVIQGPPGTGKSQTITNLVAESLGAGKKVLFVSEKRAALEVVKNRLDKVGIGDFCLEIHSKDSSKRGFLDSLERTLTSPRPVAPKDKHDRRQFEQSLDVLHNVGEDLLTPVANTELSPYALMGKCLHFRDDEFPRLELGEGIFLEPTTFEECERLVQEFAASLEKVGSPSDHIFLDVETTDLLPNEVEESRFVLQELSSHLQRMHQIVERVASDHDIKPPTNLGEAPLIIDLWDRLHDNPFNSVTDMESIDWSVTRDGIQSFASAFLDYSKRYKKLSEFYIPSAIPWNELEHHRQVIEKSSGSFLRMFNGEYKRSCKAIKDALKTNTSMGGEDLLKAIKFLQESQDEKRGFEAVEQMGPYITGPVWNGIETPESVAIPRIRWVQQTLPIVGSRLIEPLALAKFSQSGDWKKSLQDVEELEKTVNHVKGSLEALNQILFTPKLKWQLLLDVPISGFIEKIELMRDEVDALWDWVEFRRSEHLLLESPVSHITQLAMEGRIHESNAMPALYYHYYRKLLDQAYLDRPGLAGFRKDSVEASIRNFQNLDKKLMYHARQRLAYELGKNSPRIIEGLSGNTSELGLLQREIHKKRRIKPIRRILEEAGTLVQKIKPCFMMSPLSVARFLPPGSLEFDVVIFDEASQVKPEDALGAIARGKQVIVVGDSKQLPPTRFFSKLESEETDWEEEDESLTDLESILDACSASGMPSTTLSWHYRSKHDSLIATSNREFYENKLTIFPSPFERNDKLGLQFIRVEDGLFERGKSGTNPVEARRVAEAVIHHARTRAHDSLGVGTFSIRQQTLILDEIEKLRREAADPILEKFFSSDHEESFFVKNLENIQGDERDVIFLSVCYAKHDPAKPMAMNFGPLNQEGGERRLNVLITRAKKKCVVFSSIGSEAIDLERTDSRGVKAFKAFLHFAEYGGRDFAEDGLDENSSPFESRVHDQLYKLGYQVVRQVGTGVFRLNFGIRHPENPGQFALGLECDGAAYRNAPGSRERERTRPSVLGHMGWHLIRVWSVEYYKNPDNALEYIRKELEKAISSGASPRTNDPDPEFEGIDIEEELEQLDLSGLGVPYQEWSGTAPKTGRTLAKEIVYAEGPIHEEHLILRLKEILEVPRLTSKARTELQNHILTALRDRVIQRLKDEDQIFVGKDFEVSGFLPRHREKPPTNLEFISSLEILSAAGKIVEVTGDIPQDELIKNVSLLLGYRALTGKVQARLDEAMSRTNLKMAGLKMDHRKKISLIAGSRSIFDA